MQPSEHGSMPTSKGELYYIDENGEQQDAVFHEEILSEGDERGAHNALRPYLKDVLGLTDGEINNLYGPDLNKKFDPSQPRDMRGRWSEEGNNVLAYHGTTERAWV